MSTIFDKPFTQQEPISEAAIEAVSEVLRSGRLHRYNVVGDEPSEVALLEAEYAAWQGVPYCIATSSGGAALQMALRAVGVKPGDQVLANAYTLAPVPGAIHAAGGVPVFVEIDENWHIDLDDLERKAASSDAKVLMLSHMRGHLANMEAIADLCARRGITMIEDCAHTMGARWDGVRSGNFGAVAAFSTQTYKHMNSGEGGFLTTSDPEIAARATILSGSYMLYGLHGAVPDESVFARVKQDEPNCSSRMDMMRAVLLRHQLPVLVDNIERWNERYWTLVEGLRASNGITVPARDAKEHFVASSIQFHPHLEGAETFETLLANCARRGVELKWFGADKPKGFTSRYDSWTYLNNDQDLQKTRSVLATTCDMRIPLTFSIEDCAIIAGIIVEEVNKVTDG